MLLTAMLFAGPVIGRFYYGAAAPRPLTGSGTQGSKWLNGMDGERSLTV